MLIEGTVPLVLTYASIRSQICIMCLFDLYWKHFETHRVTRSLCSRSGTSSTFWSFFQNKASHFLSELCKICMFKLPLESCKFYLLKANPILISSGQDSFLHLSLYSFICLSNSFSIVFGWNLQNLLIFKFNVTFFFYRINDTFKMNIMHLCLATVSLNNINKPLLESE